MNQEALLNRLLDGEVEFVVVGGFAGTAHGVTLLTFDLDVCAPLEFSNLERLQSALAGTNPRFRMTADKRPWTLSVQTRRLKRLDLETELGTLDVLGAILGVGDYPSVRKRSVTIDFSGRALSILDIDALIESKRLLNRPRDLQAIVELEAIRERREPRE